MSASGKKQSKKPSTPLLSISAKKKAASARHDDEDTPTASRKQTKARSSHGSAAAAPTPKARGRPRSAHSPAIAAAAASPSSLLFTPTRRPILERATPAAAAGSASIISSTPSRASGLHSLSERASTPPRFGSEEKAAAAIAAKAAAAAKATAAKPAPARPSVTPTARRSHVPAAGESRSSTPPSEHDRSAWATMLATADLGSIVAAPAAAMDALHGWESHSHATSTGAKGSPTKKRRASPKRVEKQAEEEEEEKENAPQSPAKKARKVSVIGRAVATRSIDRCPFRLVADRSFCCFLCCLFSLRV